jgi:hypothetical protein
VALFRVEERDHVRDRVLRLAASDERVVAGAVVGSQANGPGDRWSDLDLTFAVADGVPVSDVLEDWTRALARELDATHLFDVPNGPTIYRVFVLPGCLQLDVSFTPLSRFGARGPEFRLLFGRSVETAHAEPPSAPELFGHAVHHLLRARFCIERRRLWQSEYWISGARDCALALACRRRGLPASYGRGFDRLPPDVRDGFRGALVTRLDRIELLRALGEVVDGLLREGAEADELAARTEPVLRELTGAWEEDC